MPYTLLSNLSRLTVFASTIVALGLIATSAQAGMFNPPPNQDAPKQSTGGASRGSFFTPPPDNQTPQTTGGASRGNFFKPMRRRAPQTTAGGAARTANADTIVAANLMAVLPRTYYGTTVLAHPTILAYLPASKANTAVFSLKNEAGKTLYQSEMTVPQSGGVMRLILPSSAPELAVGQNYQWFLGVKVDGELSPSTPYIDGWIQRIQPPSEITLAMQQGSALRRATALGANGIWYDCADTLANWRQQQPENSELKTYWSELLQGVGLEPIADSPVITVRVDND